MVQLEGLGQLKYPMTSSGIELATFWLVVLWPTQFMFPLEFLKSNFISYRRIR
jgi:hypothetical protein